MIDAKKGKAQGFLTLGFPMVSISSSNMSNKVGPHSEIGGGVLLMFVARPYDAARELACVCTKGGRLGICTRPPGDTEKVRRLDRFESDLREV